jgi:HPt (histidine-containing phosphotransfer) domain-containing protein
MNSQESLLDKEILDENADIGLDGLRELLDLYLAQADEILGQLKAAIDAGAAADVKELAHKLAGSSAVCGVNVMVQPLRALEYQAREGQLTEANQMYAQITENLDLSRRLLAEYLSSKE